MGNNNTLHILGGGVFVKHFIDIAKSNGWKVVFRSSERFLGDRLFTSRVILEDALTTRIQYSPIGSVFDLKKRV